MILKYHSHCNHWYKIFFILGDGMTITTVENLSYDHTSFTYTIDGQEVVMAAEVGLLSRKIKIVGHNSLGSSDQETEEFGCRVIVG